MSMRVLGCVAAGLLWTGCVHERPREVARCPESQDRFCLTAVECSMDKKRGCEVCQCSKGPTAMPEDDRLPSGVPPDQRLQGN
ncbi:hypothetical protein JGU66_06135 [Myxococcaceae bacterium JPH2]|nr:hypothetical protein [Myxococcaceae bacterium JPH2]